MPERERRSEVRVKAEKCVYDVCGALGNSVVLEWLWDQLGRWRIF